MREILFRGKRLDNSEWVEGFYVAHLNAAHYIIPCRTGGYEANDGSFYIHKWWAVDPATVGQYTGLKDKNGKRIFEWDVCRFEYTGENRGVEGIAALIFESGKFGVRWGWHKEFVCLDGFANTTIEVIGNIHDNPELLEV